MRYGGLFFLLAIVAASPAAAAGEWAPWCEFPDRGYMGKHFYCDPSQKPAPEPEPEPQAATTTSSETKPKDARDELRQIQEELDRLKAEAVLRPTPENLSRYMAYQQEQIERASLFSDQWRRVLWEDPELDYTVKRPVNTVGKRVWKDQRRASTTEHLIALNDKYGLFFFFTSSCEYCKAYSPILKAFSAQYGIQVQAVSLDGGTLPEWPDAVRDNGQAIALGIADKPVPATLLFDAKARKVIPIGYGLLSQAELEEKIYVQTALGLGDDY